MIVLEKRFQNEIKNVDVLHTDIECDTGFIIEFIHVLDYWRIYNNTPEFNKFKNYYYGILRVEIDKLKSYWEKEVSLDES